MASPTTKTDLPSALTSLGLHATASTLDDFLARATNTHWPARQMLEELVRVELDAHHVEPGPLEAQREPAGPGAEVERAERRHDPNSSGCAPTPTAWSSWRRCRRPKAAARWRAG